MSYQTYKGLIAQLLLEYAGGLAATFYVGGIFKDAGVILPDKFASAVTAFSTYLMGMKLTMAYDAKDGVTQAAILKLYEQLVRERGSASTVEISTGNLDGGESQPLLSNAGDGGPDLTKGMMLAYIVAHLRENNITDKESIQSFCQKYDVKQDLIENALLPHTKGEAALFTVLSKVLFPVALAFAAGFYARGTSMRPEGKPIVGATLDGAFGAFVAQLVAWAADYLYKRLHIPRKPSRDVPLSAVRTSGHDDGGVVGSDAGAGNGGLDQSGANGNEGPDNDDGSGAAPAAVNAAANPFSTFSGPPVVGDCDDNASALGAADNDDPANHQGAVPF